MLKNNKVLILRGAAALVSVAICLIAYLATPSQSAGEPPWYGVIPPLLAITTALVTGRILYSLGAAVLVGGLLSLLGDGGGRIYRVFLGTGARFVYDSVANRDNQLILLYVVLIMAMISVMLVGGGLQGVANWLMRFARSPRSTKLVTFVAGLIIFIDDYANTMIVGSTFRPMTDRQRISREKLAFLVDATAAPIAGIAVISTWIGFEVSLLGQVADGLNLGEDGYAMFFDALGFRFYCIGMIVFVFFNVLSGVDFGPMARAEERARTQGKLLADGARPMTSQAMAAARPHPDARVHAAVAVVPMVAVLIAFVGMLWFVGRGELGLPADLQSVFHFSAWREVLGEVNSIPLLVYASGLGLLLALLLARVAARTPTAALFRAVLLGIKSSLLPMTVLVLAWSLKGACDELQTGKFLANAVAGSLRPLVFPALVFVVAGLTSFATGTSWGTMGILIPIAIPAAFELDGGIYGPITIVSIAAVLDGAIFGDHCSPISDTTIMSSTASSCDHLAHVRTQIPYSMVVAAFALGAGYLPAAAGYSMWVGILGGAAASGLLFLGLWIFRSSGR